MHKIINTNERSAGLDLFRIIAMLLVFVSHAFRGNIGGIYIGPLGVDLFFVLSGFLVAKPFFTQKNEFSFSFISFFLIKRWLRTLPLYYLIISVKIIFTHFTFKDSWFYFIFIQTYGPNLQLSSVSWSLSVEEWFYLLFPLGTFIFVGANQNTKRMLCFLISIILIEIIFRSYVVLLNQLSWEEMCVTVHFRFDSLTLGVLMCLLKYRYKNLYLFMAQNSFFSFALVLFIIYLLIFRQLNLSNQINTGVIVRVFSFTLLSTLIALLLPKLESAINLSSVSLTHKLISQFLKIGSALTYAFYLIHYEVIQLLEMQKLNHHFKILLAFVVTILLSLLLHYLFEKPFLIIKNKIKID